MYICYLDESGTIEPNSSSTHFILIGVAIPAITWKRKDAEISVLKNKFGLAGTEIHAGWMMRPYIEQSKVPGFASLDYGSRKKVVLGLRALNLARPRSNSQQKELLKNYRKTEGYIHLSEEDRRDFLIELSKIIGNWGDCRIFGEAHDKSCSLGEKAFEIAFEQIVTRFNTFLSQATGEMGILVQDHNETICRRLTAKMREFHKRGTLWSAIDNIVETPLFVDSQLTSMVQIADVCAYTTRRFFEKNEDVLFNLIYDRFDRYKGRLVGLRHYTGMQKCMCRVCADHGRS